MRKTFKFFLSAFVYLVTFGAIALAGGLFWTMQQFKLPGPLSAAITMEVPRGASLRQIASNLEQAGVIQDKLIFIAGTRVFNEQGALKAGEYEFKPGISPQSTMEMLRDGIIVQRSFTIPEGLTSYEISVLLSAIPLLTGDITALPEEGTLLPETYHYKRNEPRSAVLARMSTAMSATLNEVCGIAIREEAPSSLMEQSCPGAEERGLLKTAGEVLTLASIVEKETAQADERKIVAGVFLNRLKRGMALQTDPTVIYGITMGVHKNAGKGPLGRRLLKKDLEYDSPYNTYKYPGLPPGPIANPGRASLEAVLNPEEHDYIYFVADGSGGHAFAKTLKEHNKNVARWRKIRKAQK